MRAARNRLPAALLLVAVGVLAGCAGPRPGAWCASTIRSSRAPAGDGLTVTVSTEAVRVAGGVEEALADSGVVSDFPLFPEAGDVVPA
ncbi:hypothetical protein [Geodermatophilus sp. URMC 64]